MKYDACVDCGKEKTGGQQQCMRCRNCSSKLHALKMIGNTYSIENKSLTGQTRSTATRQAISFGHGGTGELNRIYPGLQRWTRLVKERDNYRCAECEYQGTKGKKDVDAHHIIYKASHPELATVLFNGVTLCKPCHENIHNREV